MIGSSGVGKSTILNRLLGDERQRTTAVRAGDSRGRHTTTTRELFVMPGGWLLMDLPGLREVQLWATTEDLTDSFEDIQELAGACRFRDCAHAGEPGCAVEAAGLEPGRLPTTSRCSGNWRIWSGKSIRGWPRKRGPSGRRSRSPCGITPSETGDEGRQPTESADFSRVC